MKKRSGKHREENENPESFKRRALVVGGIQLGLLMVLGGRLSWLQVAQGHKYKTLADNNRIDIKMLAPSRGRIIDRFGTPLAINDQDFRVLLVPEQAQDIEKVISSLQKLISIEQSDIKRVLKAADRQASFVPVEVMNSLNWEEVSTIEVNLPDLPGLSIDIGEIRSYPYNVAAAHVVGYVGAVNESEIDEDPVLKLPGMKIGKTGLERFYDSALRGKAGAAQMEVNVAGREVRELGRNDGLKGKSLKLSLDIDLQIAVHERLEKERSASAVVMDAHTGAIYALCSVPAFDPNLFTRGLSVEKWESLLADPGLPLNNKAVGGQYPPGSTFKMVTAMAALETGLITKNTSFHCPGYFEYGNNRFHCWKHSGHGKVNVVDSLEQSCDVFFYEVATRLGIDTLASYAEKFGYGQKLGFEMFEERPGLMPTKSWKRGKFGKSWQPGETINASIGQGYILATPLQLAVMTARLVNGGKKVSPWISEIKGRAYGVNPKWEKLEFQKKNLDLVIEGMRRVVDGAEGTAKASQIGKADFKMGGKTGTRAGEKNYDGRTQGRYFE